MFNGIKHMFHAFHSWSAPAPSHERDEERPFRVLIPVSGGPNATAALGILPGIANGENEITFLHVRAPGAAPARGLLEGVLESCAGLPRVEAREVFSDDPADAIVEASAAADLVVLGASSVGRPFGQPILDIVRRSSCPVIVVRRDLGRRHVEKEGPRAIVVAESSPVGMLGLERALRWAKSGSVSQEILLVPAPREVREHDPERRKLDLRQYATRSVHVAKRALTPEEILAEIHSQPRDLVVLACDPYSALDDGAWTSHVAAGTSCSVVCVFASRTGPRTRRRRIAVPV